MRPVLFALPSLSLLALALCSAGAAEVDGGWSRGTPVAQDHLEGDPLHLEFAHLAAGEAGPGSAETWAIGADGTAGGSGRWSREFPVTGGRWYRFSCARRSRGLDSRRRETFVRVNWIGPGSAVKDDDPATIRYPYGTEPDAQPSYAHDGGTDPSGWTELSGTWQAPSKATAARIELWYLWAPRGRVEWTSPAFAAAEAPPARPVRLAAVHYRPHGGHNPAENRRLFAPCLEQAGAERADLVVLPEMLTYCDTGLPVVACAESVPGPSTAYFGRFCKKFGYYLVAGLVERDGDRAYNTAVLIGPDGRFAGKYRKVVLPRFEIESGLTPGSDYPVFPTRFGKLGIMICYDGGFPEVARQLADRGAEVIAWPVWGCNPVTASARALENQVYLVSSTYWGAEKHWMVSGVINPEGRVIAQATRWGSVAVAQVDLARPVRWAVLGDYRDEISHFRPSVPAGN